MTEEEKKAAAESQNTGQGKESLFADGVPAELKELLPENFTTLPKAEQAQAVADLANKAKNADAKETQIQKQGNELGELRKFKDKAEPILQAILKGKGDTSTKDQVQVVLDKLKSTYKEEDLEGIAELVNTIVTVRSTEADNKTKGLLSKVLLGNLNMAMKNDPGINDDIYGKFEKDIFSEYGRYKEPGTYDEMVQLLKESYQKVEGREVAKLSVEARKVFEEERSKRLLGAGALPLGAKRTPDGKTEAETVQEGIVNAGGKKGSGVFG